MLSSKENTFIKKILKKNNLKSSLKIKNSYPLLENGFSDSDIMKALDVLLTKKITMGELTYKFEREFSQYIGSKYALMVNSGSSANLLAAFALINPKKKNNLKKGDSFLIPSLCWPTSLWPFVQAGLKPQFIDVNRKNFCIDENQLSRIDFQKIKLIVNIHILGNSCNMKQLMKIKKEKKIYMVEDTCEALGSKYNSKYLGTFGEFGTFSFYYSHQITSGEGGVIICQNKDDYQLLNTLRAHGWDRNLNKNNIKSFNFINSGFNVRPLDLTAAIASNQLKRLNKMIKNRNYNRDLIISALKNNKKWKSQFSFFEKQDGISPSWFGLPLLLNNNLVQKKNRIIKFLNSKGIETRPILTGNFLKHKCCKLYKFKNSISKYKDSCFIDNNGFFIGLPTEKLSKLKLDYLVGNLLSVD